MNGIHEVTGSIPVWSNIDPGGAASRIPSFVAAFLTPLRTCALTDELGRSAR